LGSREKEDKGEVKVNINRVIHVLVVVIVLIMSLYSYAHAAGSECLAEASRSDTESSVIVGYGTGDVAEGDYEPILLIWRMGWNLKKFFPDLENHTGTISFYVEPQINPVFNRETDIECGVGVGLKYMYPLTDSVGAYIFGSVGPHYISVHTSDQANGFIFSDTLGAGLSFFITGKSAITVEYRRRHMSNAAMVNPNVGIDNNFGTIGYSVFF